MFGWLRFLLAFCVAFAHAGLEGPGGRHLGVPAVVVFYLISGYVVSAQWHQLRGQADGLAAFYRDRALRVLPLYYLTLLVSALFLHWQAPSTYFASRSWDAACWMSNLLVIPLDWFPYTSVDQCTYVPPAWSLGLEMQFYLLAPLLFSIPAWRNVALWSSVGIYAAAAWSLVPGEIYGYRLLPGTLFMFLAGGLLEAQLRRRGRPVQLVLLWLALAGIGLGTWRSGHLGNGFNIETLIGFLAGLPLVALATRWRRQSWDDWLAGVSYPVFLCHFILIWIFQRYGGELPGAAVGPSALYIILLTGLGALFWHGCDQPLTRLRRRLRRNT